MNIQQTIIEGISEQLYFNDYMVLPDFGGFVLKSKPAHFSATGSQIVPPSKTVSFNAQFRQNDGIMVLWLSKKINCAPDTALKHLRDFADYCSGLLQSKRRFSLNGIGFFYLDFENNICFEPQKDVNFLRDSFGLGPVSLTEVAVQPVVRKTELKFVDRSPVIEQPLTAVKTKRNLSRLVLPAAIVTLFCSMIILVLSGTRLTGELRSSLAGSDARSVYQPMNYSELDLTAPAPVSSAYVADANGIAVIELGEHKRLHVNISSNESAALSHNSASIIKGKYEVVLGCFSVKKNAKKLIGRLSKQNIKARLSGPSSKKLYVVSQVNFDSKQEALNALRQVKDEVAGAWIRQSE
jgi:hypothetical protein